MGSSLSKALVAEFIGTFALIFIGAGAGALGLGGLLGVAFAHGLVVVGFAYSYGHISGTHINPAVTLAVWVAREIETPRAMAYMVTQLAGGVAGAFLLAFCLGGTETGLGVTILARDLQAGGASITVTPAMGFVVEVVLTFFLVNAVLNAGISGKVTSLAGMAIGLTLVACILVGGPLTGASLNPARTLGPALASGIWSDFWLYMVAPPLGGILAAVLHRGLLEER